MSVQHVNGHSGHIACPSKNPIRRVMEMFKRKLFKRALPVILSVAMIFQSMPATALAAENEMTEVVETTVEDSGSESDG